MTATGDSKYRPGQVWDYETRPSDPLSTLTILKISTMPDTDTVIVHIAIDDVHLTYPDGGEIGHVISHTPVTPEVLDKSVTNLVKDSGPIPDFERGYLDWKADWDDGTGGVFDRHTVAQVVTLIENAWRYGTEKPNHQ